MSLAFEVIDGVAELRLARPDDGNALDMATALALRDAVHEIGVRREVRAVALTAAGPLFCAGGDVRAMAAAPDRSAFVYELAGVIHEALLALRALPAPIVAAVQGTAAGAGVGLVLAADIALASENAKFLSAYNRIGLSPDCGVSALLGAVVGRRRAALFTLTDMMLDARTALDWGLISEVCRPDDLDARLRETLDHLRSQPDRCLGETARLLRGAADGSFAQQLEKEAATIARLAGGGAAAVLIDAFAAR